MMVRQGDVLLLLVSEIPADAELVQEGGAIILAHGETTGHMHQVKSVKTKLFKPPTPTADQLIAAANQILRAPQERSAQATQTRAYLEVPEPTEIVHEEHAAIPLPAGTYKVIIQREYKPSNDSSESNLFRSRSNNWKFVED